MSAAADPSDRWRLGGAVVPLGGLADVRVVSGPPMIKDEDGVLVGYVFADLDTSARDIGGWVNDAKRAVAAGLRLPAGYRLAWTGQYELMEEMLARMAWVMPLVLVGVVLLLRMGMRGWSQTGLVLTTLPFALVGSIWLLWLRHYNLSTAVWVGIIAVIGAATETGTVMIEFLDSAIARLQATSATPARAELEAAVAEGATGRIRPIVMSVFSTVLGLLPLLWEAGPGADVSARIAGPVIGGLLSCFVLTLVVLPAFYAAWRVRQLARGELPVLTNLG
jgi:Cu(I)/Ag(I) efflux system membrane protein CusA/SilA